MRDALFLFATTHDVISAERLAAERGFKPCVVPEPPGRTARCGIALQVPGSHAAELKTVLDAEGFKDVVVEFPQGTDHARS